MRHRATPAFLVATTVAALTACATIASGTTQTISVSSNVEGAEVLLDGQPIGETPFTGPIEKNKNTLQIEAEGYRAETVTLSKSLDPVFWGNIIIGGTLGSITDFATGAAYQYAPATYQVELQAAQQSDEAYREQLVLRKFSMLYIDEISRDLSRGEGDYLSALVALVNDYSATTIDDSAIAEALAKSNGEPTRFGSLVVDLNE